MSSNKRSAVGDLVDDLHSSKRLRVDEEDDGLPLTSLDLPPLPLTSPLPVSSAAAAVAAASPLPLHPHLQLLPTGGPRLPPLPLLPSDKLDSLKHLLDPSHTPTLPPYDHKDLDTAGEMEGEPGTGVKGEGVKTGEGEGEGDVEMKEGKEVVPGEVIVDVPSTAEAPPAPKPTVHPPPIVIPIPTTKIVCIHPDCTSKFTSEKGLARHMSKHAVDKKPSPHVCEVCKGSFATKANLKVHTRIHTGEKPFKCDICQKTFRQLSGLEGHKKTHTGEKPYACEKCGRTFAQKGTLHQHVLSHTGEKPHKCDICQRGFTQLSTLLQHKRTHSGLRPFVCKVSASSSLCPHHLPSHLHSSLPCSTLTFLCSALSCVLCRSATSRTLSRRP